MSGIERFGGGWDVSGLSVDVRIVGDHLELHLPGVPAGFDAQLEPVATYGSFVVSRGPYRGVEVVFEPDDADHARFGPITATRSDGTYLEPAGTGLLAPTFDPESGEDGAYAALEERFNGGKAIDWTGGRPNHRFVQWLNARDRYIFHGSNNTAIETFAPVRSSVELGVASERGNLDAVYGTHSGLWAMFFAIADRQNLKGSIRNGFVTAEAEDGATVDVYQFSVHHESLEAKPFTSGALYILPRESFQRLSLWPGGPQSNEWASAEPVVPLAKLHVEPGDFPFLADVGGHDDGPLLAMFDLFHELANAASTVRATDDGFVLELEWTDETAERYGRWLALWRQYMPAVQTELSGSAARRS